MDHYLYLAKDIAERIWTKLPDKVELNDLIQVGIFGLMDAIDAFTLENGIKFETFCKPRIRGCILDELRSRDWVPRLVRAHARQSEMARAKFPINLEREPKEKLRQLISKDLTRSEKLIIVLYYYEEMTYKEIAAVLEISKETVIQMHQTTIQKLKK